MSFNCSTDEKEKQDPLAFRDAIIQGLQDIGNNDLEQVSYTISFLCALLLKIIGMLYYVKFLWSYWKSSFNPLTSRTDKHVTSPYIYPYIIQQTGNENTQTHQVQDITLIEHQILVANLQ